MSPALLSIIIMLITLLLYGLNLFPIVVTSILAMLAFPLLGITSFTTAFSSYGTSTIMFLIGMSIISNSLFHSGAADFVGPWLIRYVCVSEKATICILYLLTAFVSGFFSNLAVALVFLPVASSIAAASGGRIRRKHLYLPVGIAATIGGNLTMAGSMSKVAVQAMPESTQGVRTMGFFEGFWVTIPTLLSVVLCYYLFIYRYHEKVFDFEEQPDTFGGNAQKEIRLDPKKLFLTLLAFLWVIICFSTGILNGGAAALLGACFVIITKCIDGNEAFKSVDWKTVMMVGAAVSFADALAKSGDGELIANFLMGILGDNASAFTILAVLSVTAAILTSIMSNAGVMNIFTPIAISIALQIRADPAMFDSGIMIASASSYVTPVCTSSVAVTASIGYRFKDYVQIGGLITLITTVCAIISVWLVYSYIL